MYVDIPYGSRYDWVDPYDNRTPEEYPYSYSPYYLFRDGDMKGTDAIYTDRLNLWFDSKKVQSAMKGFRSYGVQPINGKKTCQGAIDALYGKGRYKVVGYAIGCNVGNGYPYGIFFLREVNK